MPRTTKKTTIAPEPPPVVTEIGWKEAAEIRDEQLSVDLDLRNLKNDERAFLAQCQHLYRENRGDLTPFPNFILNVVHLMGATYRWLDLNEVRAEFEEFEDKFQQTAFVTRTNMKRYGLEAMERI